LNQAGGRRGVLRCVRRVEWYSLLSAKPSNSRAAAVAKPSNSSGEEGEAFGGNGGGED